MAENSVSTDVGSRTSQLIAIAPFPANEAVSSRVSTPRPEHTTVNPARASAMVEARPMPLPPPVTSATVLTL